MGSDSHSEKSTGNGVVPGRKALPDQDAGRCSSSRDRGRARPGQEDAEAGLAVGILGGSDDLRLRACGQSRPGTRRPRWSHF